jgi:hypothetical protein
MRTVVRYLLVEWRIKLSPRLASSFASGCWLKDMGIKKYLPT